MAIWITEFADHIGGTFIVFYVKLYCFHSFFS